MSDEDDAPTLLPEEPDRLQQTLHFKRRQHCRRFIQDEKSEIAVEGFEDLQSLPFAYREEVRGSRGINCHPVFSTKRCKLLDHLLAIEQTEFRLSFVTEHHVLCRSERIDEHKVLVDHLNSDVVGGSGRDEMNTSTINPDVTGIGSVETREYVHQRGLASPVLTKDRMNLRWRDVQRDVVERDDIAKVLGDRPQLDERITSGGIGLCGCAQGVVVCD